MKEVLIVFVILTISIFATNFAFSQEMRLATFQETAQIIIDKSISQNVTASITLQSTSIQEIRIPPELEQKIRDNERISAIVVTNEDQCVLGVFDQSCILINVKRDPQDKGILEIQNSTKNVATAYIDEVNQVFDTNAKFHSVYVHSDDEINNALTTSGIVSGRGTVSAVYTMPMEDTNSMYEKFSAILIPSIIRESGGFYDVARNLADEENAKVTFSLIPSQSKTLLQLKLSKDYPHIASTINQVNPLEFLKTDELKRSEYFSVGFYPLNSIIQIVILSPEEDKISNVKGEIVPSQEIEGEKIPIDISKAGWIFDPELGERIQGKYIFGQKTSVSASELIFSLGDNEINETSADESIVVVAIITIIAIAAAVFYLKGYKK